MSGTLRLRGSTSGYSELQAPAVAADQTFVFPTAGGTLLTTDSSIPKLTLELGSASQPSLTFEGDTDTGLYSSGTNTLNLVTGGSNRLVIDSSGNVGIGTSSASDKLQVSGGIRATGEAAWGSGAEGAFIDYYAAGSMVRIGHLNGSSGSAKNINFYSGGSNVLAITSTGNVGIGESNPLHNLHVKGALSTVAAIQSTNTDVYLRFINNTNSFGYIEYNTTAMSFWTNNNRRMTIDGSGRLLVGRSSSSILGYSQYARLQVQGHYLGSADEARISFQRGESSASMSNGDKIALVSFADQDGGEYALIEAYADNTPGSSDYPGRLVFSTTSDGATSSTERMRIDSAGRVGVGVTPADFGTGANAVEIHSSGSVNSFLSLTNSTSGSGGSANGFNIIASGTEARLFNRENGDMTFWTNATERMRINSAGDVYSVPIYNNSAAISANVFVTSSGNLGRATSSAKYKTSIETIEDVYSDALLNCRPVWYRSTSNLDDPDHSWWGFIAEEVAEIDPRLVFWKTTEVTYDENGSAVESPCDPEPEGVAYDRFVPHLLNLIKRQKEQIETLEANNLSLENRIAALENN